MEHVGEEGAAGRAGSLSLRREPSGARRAAQQLLVSRTVLSIGERVDERVDNAGSPSQDGSHHVNDGHFGLFLINKNMRVFFRFFDQIKSTKNTSSSATLTTMSGRKQSRKQQKMSNIMRVSRRSSLRWCFSDELFLLFFTGRFASSCRPLVPGLFKIKVKILRRENLNFCFKKPVGHDVASGLSDFDEDAGVRYDDG